MFEILETEATGRVAEIYDDIRQTLDMSMVNTIWRSLALKEEVLEWVWSSLKPIYQNGSVRHYASKLHSQINLDNVSPIPLPAFRILGVSDKDKDDLKNLMDDLAYSNAHNIIAFKALLNEPSQQNDIETISPKNNPRKKYDLPKPINLEDLSTDEKELFEEIRSIGGTVSVGFPPMWLRGVARYPALMPLVWATLTQIEAAGQLADMKEVTREASDRYSSILSAYVERTPRPDTASEAIERLGKLCDAIPRAIPICLALKKAVTSA